MSPGMTLEWPWNPNHKFKFYTLDGDKIRWLFRIAFSNKDQSLYLIPLYDRDFVIRSLTSNPVEDSTHKQGQNFKLSLHESGVVNLTTSSGSVRIRDTLDTKHPVRQVATLQINSTDNLPTASLEEINSPQGGYLYLPVFGFPRIPIMLSMLCSEAKADWSPPGVGNVMNINYKTRMKDKAHFFHFVVWQDGAMSQGEGDIGLSWGDQYNSLFGL